MDTTAALGPTGHPPGAVPAPHPGLLLGTGDGGWTWSGPGRSVLVLGPSRSGKTSSLVLPNIVASPGPVVSTSTKLDVLAATAEERARRGWVYLYDPSGTVDVPPAVQRVGWSPVAASGRWDGALLTATSMVRASRMLEGGRGPAEDHWSERAGALLAPLLHAAALRDEPMSRVLSWVDRHDGRDALDALADRDEDAGRPADVLAGILTTDAREQSGIWSSASGILAAYRSTAALRSTEAPLLDAGAFVSGSDTLYICAPGRHQRQAAPLVVGMLEEIRDAAYRQASQSRPARSSAVGRPAPSSAVGRAAPSSAVGPTPPPGATGNLPLLLALDEAANIAPLPDLPSLVSEGPGQGVLTLACLQDLSQARRRWGAQADGFVSLFGTTVVLGGVADVTTLEALSVLGGAHEMPTRTLGSTRGSDGRLQRSVTVGTTQRRRLPPDQIARGRPGRALVLDARNALGWVNLRPAHHARATPVGDALDRPRAAPTSRPAPGRERGAARPHRSPAPPRDGWTR